MPKLPPYGKALYQMQLEKSTTKNDVYIFMGINAWHKAQAFQASRPSTMCLPPGELPISYLWPVEGCDILLFDTGHTPMEEIDIFARILLESHAKIIRVISNHQMLAIFNQ